MRTAQLLRRVGVIGLPSGRKDLTQMAADARCAQRRPNHGIEPTSRGASFSSLVTTARDTTRWVASRGVLPKKRDLTGCDAAKLRSERSASARARAPSVAICV